MYRGNMLGQHHLCTTGAPPAVTRKACKMSGLKETSQGLGFKVRLARPTCLHYSFAYSASSFSKPKQGFWATLIRQVWGLEIKILGWPSRHEGMKLPTAKS